MRSEYTKNSQVSCLYICVSIPYAAGLILVQLRLVSSTSVESLFFCCVHTVPRTKAAEQEFIWHFSFDLSLVLSLLYLSRTYEDLHAPMLVRQDWLCFDMFLMCSLTEQPIATNASSIFASPIRFHICNIINADFFLNKWKIGCVNRNSSKR